MSLFVSGVCAKSSSLSSPSSRNSMCINYGVAVRYIHVLFLGAFLSDVVAFLVFQVNVS